MTATILIVGLAWYALMLETHWLTINLCQWCNAGDCCAWRLPDSAVTFDMKLELLRLSGNGHRLCNGEFKEWITPLCGWGFAYQAQNFKPEYKIVLIDGTSTLTINSNSIPHLKDAFKVWRNPYIKVRVLAKARA